MSKADDELFELKSSRTGEYLHSKSADEMFKELGYKKNLDTEYEVEYYIYDIYITFDKEKRTIQKKVEFDFELAKSITMQELQAINEKVKELGWID